MQSSPESTTSPDLADPIADLEEIGLMLWRQRQKILFLGIGAMTAGIIFAQSSSLYESAAKIYIRYVQDSSPVDAFDHSTVESDSQRARLINNEVEILTSADLTRETALAVGLSRFRQPPRKPLVIPGLNPSPPLYPQAPQLSAEDAGQLLALGLSVEPKKDSAVIQVSYRNAEAELTTTVLEELIHQYFDKHLEVHRPTAGTLVTDQTGRIEKRINELDIEIDQTMRDAGIVSTGDCLELIEKQRYQLRGELVALEGELAGAKARIQSLEPTSLQNDPPPLTTSLLKRPSEAHILRYQGLLDLASQLRKRNLALTATFTPKSPLVRNNSILLERTENERRTMAENHPQLASLTHVTREDSTFSSSTRFELDIELANLAHLQSKRDHLYLSLENCDKIASELPARISRIERLVRLREQEQRHLTLLHDRLRKVQVDAELDSTKMPNLTILQSPTHPVQIRKNTAKFAAITLILGLGLGIISAFITELFIDQRVKSPQTFWKHLGIPLLISIPRIPNIKSRHGKQMMLRYTWDLIELLYEAPPNPTTKTGPKIVAVSGAGRRTGSSYLTRIIAETLESQGERVLVIDHKSLPSIARNLLATEDSAMPPKNSKPPTIEWESFARHHLSRVATKLQNANYDCVLLDMPLVGPGVPTRAIVNFVHKILLVSSPDQTERAQIRCAYELLTAAGADVACIFNKVHPVDCKITPPRWAQSNQSPYMVTQFGSPTEASLRTT